MKQLVLDGASWSSKDDVYDAFFKVVGAPSWHGRNLDALNDSIAGGSINEIEVPYRLIIRNFDLVGAGAKKTAQDFVDLIRELAAHGTPVAVEIQNSH
jgi:RNAse (barnase) inhibitor barstar